MTVNYTTNLSLGQPVTGTESGTWGDDVNNAVTSYLDIAIAGGLAVTVTTADVTLTLTQGTSSATNIGSTTAQYAILNVSGAMTAARNLIVPSSSRIYLINNNTTGGFALTVKGSATSGVTLVNGETAHVFWNGTDYAKMSNSSGGAGSFSSITDTGNLTFTGTGNRITGDMSNATVASRVMFQSSTVNGSTVVGAMPNGTSGVAQFGAFSSAGLTDYSSAVMQVSAATGSVNIISGQAGAGSYYPILFLTGGSERMRLDTSGNVGIGGNNTGAYGKFGVIGTSYQSYYVQSSDASGVVAIFAANSSFEARIGTATNHPTAFYTNGTEKMRIDSSGNVGIGTSSPASYGKLVSAGAFANSASALGVEGASTAAIINTSSAAINEKATLNLWSNPASKATIASYYEAFIGAANTSTGLIFGTQPNNTGVVERMRIDSSGNVGIGTNSPGTKLQAVGIIKSGATGTNGEFNLARTSDGLSVGKITLTESTSILDYNNLLGAGLHTFTINAVERVRINSNGELLLTTAAGLGYGTGSGGTVTQATSKSTGVTLNKPTGRITMTADAMLPAATAQFTFTNSLIAATDLLQIAIYSPSVGNPVNYRIGFGITSGSATVFVTNQSAGSLSEGIQLNFVLIKGATS